MPDLISDTSARFALPFLFVGQAQKEIFHNEALLRIDALLVPLVEGSASDPDALSPLSGQCWIIGESPVGIWVGRANQVAIWSDGGWRYSNAVESMRVYDVSAGASRIFRNDGWTSPPMPPIIAEGAIVDAEARAAIGEIITLLQQNSYYQL